MKLKVDFSENNIDIVTELNENSQTFNADVGEVTVLHDGQNGATFTPNVSPDGVISWTNDRELPNPVPVNIKGDKGDAGEKGDPGKDGQPGKDGINGKDGYTPVKGVDYFDGQNGNDGYTPVKGVDYFDGQDGQPGKDGVDGKDGAEGQPGKDATFIAVQNQTTFAEVMAAIEQDKAVFARSGKTYYVLTNYETSLIRFSRSYQSTTSHITLNTSDKWAAGSTTHSKSNHTHTSDDVTFTDETIDALAEAVLNKLGLTPQN